MSARLAQIAIALFVVGMVVLVVAGSIVLRAGAALLLIAAMFVGVGAFATPELLGEGDEQAVDPTLDHD